MMVEAAENHKARGVIVTGSTSAVGRIALNLFREKEISTIPVVRREESREEIEALGYTNVLN